MRITNSIITKKAKAKAKHWMEQAKKILWWHGLDKLTKENKEKVIRKRILTNQFPKYDGVIAISDSLVDLARKYMGEDKSILKVPILVEYEKYDMESL